MNGWRADYKNEISTLISCASIEYKKKTGKDRPIKLLNVTTHDYCKPYLKPQLLWKDMKLDEKGFPIKE